MNDSCSRFAFLWAVLVATVAAAQYEPFSAPKTGFTEPALELPANPAAWVNGAPISLSALKGKGAVLLFYEEGCPKCAAKWPDLGKLIEKHQGKPVVFIAVNSGSSRRDVEAYARRNRVAWPIIVDENRSLERAALGHEISLNNIIQMMYVTADGSLRSGSWSDYDQTVERALEGAAWRVDPVGVPTKLRQAWMSIELGDFAAAAPVLRRSLGRGDEATQSAAQALSDAVTKELTAELQAASQAKEQGDPWQAYLLLSRAVERFKGYELPESATADLAELAKLDTVRDEIKLQKKLTAAKRALAAGGARGVKRGAGALRKLIESAPDSAAAAEAQQLLASIEAG